MARSTPIPDGFLEVGHVRRAHGLRGDVFVQLVTDRTERLDVGSTLATAKGDLVVGASKLLPNGRWVVKFDQIADRTAAETWSNVAVHAAPISDADALWFHDLIGSKVVEVDGTEHGTCSNVLTNPASDILELDTGHLVPSTFIVSRVDGVVTVDTPDGLFDLLDK
ncbi:MAG: 16S rRNA processing protein RimM [Ilumatobacter sp.]|jgi:16S rRNA processing protein RimM